MIDTWQSFRVRTKAQPIWGMIGKCSEYKNKMATTNLSKIAKTNLALRSIWGKRLPQGFIKVVTVIPPEQFGDFIPLDHKLSAQHPIRFLDFKNCSSRPGPNKIEAKGHITQAKEGGKLRLCRA